MARYRRLTHPPLREALIDLRLSEQLADSFVEELADKRIPGYDTITKMFRAAVSLQVSRNLEPAIAKGAGEHFGWRFDMKDGSRVAQLRRDGMTYNVLKGYTTWDDMKSAAQDVWNLYREWGSPRLVQRVAVRYTNVIDLPVGTDADAYMTSGPRIPSDLPQMFSSFLSRVVVPFSPEKATAVITLALEAPLEAVAPVVLDIDAFVTETFAPDSPDIWTRLGALREIKNRIFFSSLTEKALEAYS